MFRVIPSIQDLSLCLTFSKYSIMENKLRHILVEISSCLGKWHTIDAAPSWTTPSVSIYDLEPVQLAALLNCPSQLTLGREQLLAVQRRR